MQLSRSLWSRARGARLILIVAAAAAATPVLTQTRFTDDAQRTVDLPARVTRVFAAGAPAEVLLYTLAPDLLVGRNRLPEGDAVEFFPPAYRTPTLIRQLPEVDNPAADAELIALKPHLYVDYGTVNADYVASLDAVQKRTGVPGIILDGALTRVPAAYRRLGAALGVPNGASAWRPPWKRSSPSTAARQRSRRSAFTWGVRATGSFPAWRTTPAASRCSCWAASTSPARGRRRRGARGRSRRSSRWHPTRW